jgi:hypothetical protein
MAEPHTAQHCCLEVVQAVATLFHWPKVSGVGRVTCHRKGLLYLCVGKCERRADSYIANVNLQARNICLIFWNVLGISGLKKLMVTSFLILEKICQKVRIWLTFMPSTHLFWNCFLN